MLTKHSCWIAGSNKNAMDAVFKLNGTAANTAKVTGITCNDNNAQSGSYSDNCNNDDSTGISNRNQRKLKSFILKTAEKTKPKYFISNNTTSKRTGSTAWAMTSHCLGAAQCGNSNLISLIKTIKYLNTKAATQATATNVKGNVNNEDYKIKTEIPAI